jgi:glutathione synthase/RimK-type ligase-like ATP-grasp enzyme
MIVIADQADGYHARVVTWHLARLGARSVIADVRELGAGAALTFSPQAPERSEWRLRDGTSLVLGEVGAMWLRPGTNPRPPTAVMQASDGRFAVQEWRTLLRGALTALEVPVINPFAAVSHATKAQQLATAVRVGLTVPDTVITNSVAEATRFAERPETVVHKTLTGMPDRTLATQRWDEEREPACLPELSLSPTIFQRRVEGTREVRITAVGERLFAAELSSPMIDARLDAAATYTPHPLPPSVGQRLVALLEALGLRFGAIDMRIDREGDYHFLEVNPSGVFLGIEARTGQPISAAVAELLVSTAARRHS